MKCSKESIYKNNEGSGECGLLCYQELHAASGVVRVVMSRMFIWARQDRNNKFT
jgi:hypothetical protein